MVRKRRKKENTNNNLIKSIIVFLKNKNATPDGIADWQSKINWSDFEEGLTNTVFNIAKSDNPDPKMSILVDELDYLNDKMQTYLETQVEDLNFSVDTNAEYLEKVLNTPLLKLEIEQLEHLKQSLNTDFSTHLSKRKSSTLTFINFNYTPLLSKYLNNINSFTISSFSAFMNSVRIDINPKILYPNGRLDNTPILGIGTERELPENLNLSNTEKRILCKELYAKYRQDGVLNNTLNVISESDIILSYSLSLGNSDALYLTKIVETLKQNKNVTAIFVMYQPKFNPAKKRKPILDEEDRIKRKIVNSYFYLHPENKEQDFRTQFTQIENQIRVLFDNGQYEDQNVKDSNTFEYFPFNIKKVENN